MSVQSSNPVQPQRSLTQHQLAAALDVVGDRWTLVVLREVFQGITRFEELQNLTGAPRSTLSARLKDLIEDGVLYKNPHRELPRRYEYRLTGKGLELYATALTGTVWEQRWSSGWPLPENIYHKTCQKPVDPKLICNHCQQQIVPEDCEAELVPGKNGISRPRRERRSTQPRKIKGVDTSLLHVMDILGDRWNALILCAAFFGVQRWDGFRSTLGIATNILARRLAVLCEAGVLSKVAYQNKPRRYDYHLTESGRDLFPAIILLMRWADRWLMATVRRPIQIRHSCGAKLDPRLICNSCGGDLPAHEVGIGA